MTIRDQLSTAGSHPTPFGPPTWAGVGLTDRMTLSFGPTLWASAYSMGPTTSQAGPRSNVYGPRNEGHATTL